MDNKNNNDKKDFNNNEKETNQISYLAIGIVLGVAIGTALKNLALGLALGIAIGAGIDFQKSREKDK